MGDATKRRRNHAALLEAQPWCVYCGGKTRATTIDHVPPISLFALRQRPKGLEVPACDACNQGSKQADHLISYVGRAYPDPTSGAEREELRRITKSINSNFPGLLEQMKPTPETQRKLIQKIGPTDGHALNTGVPAIQDALRTFAAKFGMGLHFHTTSEILPAEGGVSVRWWSNVNAIAGEIPAIVAEVFDRMKTLQQGRKEVSEQFQYDSLATPDKRFGLHWGTIRQSFAVIAFSFRDMSRLSELGEPTDKMKIVRPGDFRVNSG